MNKYYIDTRLNAEGLFEVHKENCLRLPARLEVKFLGMFDSSQDAIKSHTKAVGCKHCLGNNLFSDNGRF